MIPNLIHFSPQLALAALVIILMLQTSFYRSPRLSQLICIAGLLTAFVVALVTVPYDSVAVMSLSRVQPASHFFLTLVLLSAISTAWLQYHYGNSANEWQDEFYMLLTLATLGASIVITAAHAATLILGLELLSLSVLAMLAYQRDRQTGLEAAFKFLILSGLATATMLLGLAYLYAVSGALTFPELFTPASQSEQTQAFGTIGLFLLLIGLCFKLSLMPFHWWTPDVYHGAPVNSTLFLATVSKTAAFVVLLQVLLYLPVDAAKSVIKLLSGIAILSMVGGNLLALQQTNLKRLFAYSAIAHMGYILVAALLALNADSPLALEGASYYLLAYVLSSIAIFGALTSLSNSTTNRDCEQVQDIRGLFWRHPALASVLLVATLSMAGMPLTVGFIGKFYLLSLAVEQMAWWLIGAMILGSVIGLFYYLRVILSLFEQQDEAAVLSRRSVWLSLITLGVVLFGVLPEALGRHISTLFS